MVQLQLLISLCVILPSIVFWLWMFQDMSNNDNVPPLVTSDAKSDWLLAFIFLNVFGAMLYYSVVYRNRQ